MNTTKFCYLALDKLCHSIFLVGIFIVCNPAYADDPLSAAMGGLTMQAFLDQLEGHVQAIINSADAAGTDLVVVAGGQVISDIDIIEHTFSTDLQFQEDKIQGDARNALISLNSAVGALEKNAADVAENSLNQVQQALDTVPFANTDPRVRVFEPYMIIPPESPNDSVSFIVRGNFADAMDPDYTPTLSIDGATVKADPGSFTLIFPVPKSSLALAATLKKSQVEVDIPYKKKCLWIFPCKGTAVFKALVAELPPSPGTLKFTQTTSIQNVVTMAKTSWVISQDGTHGDMMDQPHPVSADPGWQVDPNSVQIQVTAADGDTKVGSNCSTLANACWKVSTAQHHCVAFFCPSGHDGHITFRLSYTEFQTQNAQKVSTQSIPIAWDQTQLIQLSPNTKWTAEYIDFNGIPHPFADSNTNSPFLTVKPLIDVIAISVFPNGTQYAYDPNNVSAYISASNPVSFRKISDGSLSFTPFNSDFFEKLKFSFVKSAIDLVNRQGSNFSSNTLPATTSNMPPSAWQNVAFSVGTTIAVPSARIGDLMKNLGTNDTISSH